MTVSMWLFQYLLDTTGLFPFPGKRFHLVTLKKSITFKQKSQLIPIIEAEAGILCPFCRKANCSPDKRNNFPNYSLLYGGSGFELRASESHNVAPI